MTDAEQAPPRNKGGRPRKDPEKGKRQNFTFRMSEATREVVQRSADQSGRSLSEELERRVERSLDQAEMMDALVTSWELSDRAKIGAFMSMLGGPELLFFATGFGSQVRRFINQTAPAGMDPMKWLGSDAGKEMLVAYIREKAADIVQLSSSLTDGQDMKRVSEGMLMLDFKEVRRIVLASQSRS